MKKKIPGQIVLSDPQGLEFNPYFVQNMALTHCKQLRDTASPRDLREPKGTPEKQFRDRNVKMCR